MATNTYVALKTETLASNGTVTFTSIPQTYTDLICVVSNAVSPSGTPGACLRFNNDTGTNYSNTHFEGSGTTATSNRVNNSTYLNSGYNIGLSTSSSEPGSVIFHIQNYSNTVTNKSVLSRYAQPAGTAPGTSTTVGLWRNTAAITTINVNAQGGNLVAGTTVSLYGVAAETGGSTPKATGGTVTSDSTYWYHTFTTSGNFVPNQSITCDYLVVAGGGGGGATNNQVNGAGGAGGLRSTVTATGGGGSLESALSLTAQSYAVIVGAGGACGVSNGTNSSFSTITATGGGLGGLNAPGSSGGSGGGGSEGQNGGAGTANQGFAGGTGFTGPNYGTGGGGGAGGTGGNGSSSGNGGTGGIGVAISALATPTGTGASNYYAGGGGGAVLANGTVGAGGAGGGGAGAFGSNGTAVAGTASTGGGGGAGSNSTQRLANGGSGIVILRYTKA